MKMSVALEAHESVATPPNWAVLQRRLFDAIEDAAPQALARYTHPDGRLLWPPSPDFQSIDALDDTYESFHNWPLFYLLGGSDRFLVDAAREFARALLESLPGGTEALAVLNGGVFAGTRLVELAEMVAGTSNPIAGRHRLTEL